MTRKEYALELFSKGSNCSQAVAAAYAPLGAIPESSAHMIATGFGAGIARRQSICGAVSGAVMVISGMFGMPADGAQTDKQRTYREIQRFFEETEKRYQGISCKEILGRELKTTDQWARAGKEGLFGTVCPEAVAFAADYLEELARTHTDEFLTICGADPADAEELLAVQKAAFASEGRRYDNPRLSPLMETVEELKEAIETSDVQKATWKGKIIGSIRLKVDGNTGHIGRLSVEPRYQLLGIGRRLLRTIEAANESLPRFEIFTGALSSETIALYSSEGYSEFKRGNNCNGVDVVYLEKIR